MNSAGQRRILFRCDGDEFVGMGHVVRCLALAEEFRDVHGCAVMFAVASGPVGADKIREAGFLVWEKPGDVDEASWMEERLAEERPHALIMDFRTDLPRSAVRAWKENGIQVATLDDPSERRLEADLAFYPPVPQVREMDWADFQGDLYVGWEWVVLRRQFSRRFHRPRNPVPVILVTMGGSDPKGLTLFAVEALERIRDEFRAVVLLGPGFTAHEELQRLTCRASHTYEVVENVSEVAALMARADLAIASFGVTAYELAAVGVPSVLLCLTDDHARSAEGLADIGAATTLGRYDLVSSEYLSGVIDRLLHELSSPTGTRNRSSRLRPQNGTHNISAMILKAIAKDTHINTKINRTNYSLKTFQPTVQPGTKGTRQRS